MKTRRLGWIVLVVSMSVALSATAEYILFTGASGTDLKFSTAENWAGVLTGGGQDGLQVSAEHSETNEAIYDYTKGMAGKLDEQYSLDVGVNDGGAGGYAHVTMISGSYSKSQQITVGKEGWFAGVLKVSSGATITNQNQGGEILVGGTFGTYKSTMIIENGANVHHSQITVTPKGVLTFVFGSNSVTTVNTYRGMAPGSNTLNGLIQVDLANLTTPGTYTLINSSKPRLQIAGDVRTWLDGVEGSVTGTGDFKHKNFQVLNGDDKEWTLSLADNNQDLTLTIAP